MSSGAVAVRFYRGPLVTQSNRVQFTVVSGSGCGIYSTVSDRSQHRTGRLHGHSLVVEPQAPNTAEFFAASGVAWAAVRAGRHDDPVSGVRISDRRIDEQNAAVA